MKFKFLPVYSNISTPLGSMTLAAYKGSLVGTWFDGQQHQPDASGWLQEPNNAVLQNAADQLAAYFAGKRKGFDLPLSLGSGTAFQQQVWSALLTIPGGATTSYGAISQSLGRTNATRAVAAAIARNPVSIIIPCHRVLGANGSLTGYAGGLPRKAALLDLEKTL
jgi:methylated-DNA-[protein]-cysteine S-methyltransferase